MQNSTAQGAHGNTGTDAILDQELLLVKKDHEEQKEDLYASLAANKELERSLDRTLQETHDDLWGNPHYSLKKNRTPLYLELAMLAIVAFVEIAANKRGLEVFEFSDTLTWICAGGVGILLALGAFMGGLFFKKAKVRKDWIDFFIGIICLLGGFAILIAICYFRETYFSEMSETEDGAGIDISIGLQMLLSGTIYVIGMIVSYNFAKPAKDAALKEAFDAKLKEMIVLKKEIAGDQKKIAQHDKVLDARQKDARENYRKRVEDQRKTAAKATKMAGPAPKTKEQIIFENQHRDLKVKLDAAQADLVNGPIQQPAVDILEHDFTRLRDAQGKYPEGKDALSALEIQFATIKNRHKI